MNLQVAFIKPAEHPPAESIKEEMSNVLIYVLIVSFSMAQITVLYKIAVMPKIVLVQKYCHIQDFCHVQSFSHVYDCCHIYNCCHVQDCCHVFPQGRSEYDYQPGCSRLFLTTFTHFCILSRVCRVIRNPSNDLGNRRT